jgi:ethanolamine utilization protein EutN
VGEVVSTRKHESHEGQKALIVQPLNLDDSPFGNTLIALDAVEAGVGDRVLVTTEGYSAFTSVGLKLSPIDSAIIGIVDEIDLAPGAVAMPDGQQPK